MRRVTAAIPLALVLLGCGGAGQATVGPSATVGTLPTVAITSTPAPTAAACLPQDLRVSVNGVDRHATVHLPTTRSATKLPLLVAIHGFAGSPAAFAQQTRLSEHADRAGYVVIYPASMGDEWDMGAGSDIGFIEEVIDDAVGSGCIDAAQVYVTGFSMGGGMANIVGCRLADKVAGIATVAALQGPTWGNPCKPTRSVPVIAFHGTADPVLPYGGGAIVDFPQWDGRTVDPVRKWAAAWAARNGCQAHPDIVAAIDDISPLVWPGCKAPVVLYSVVDGGHTWPGGVNDPADGNASKVSADDLIWQFFQEAAGS